jgi:hypothetical protein
MKNLLNKTEKTILKKIEKGGIESIKKHAFIWCYLDGKRNGCETFNEHAKLLLQI